MSNRIFIFGAGGLGQEVLDTLFELNYKILGFVDDFYVNGSYEGYPVYRTEGKEVTKFCVDGGSIVLGIGDPTTREKIFYKLKDQGAVFPYIVHPKAYVGSNSLLEEGAFVGAGTVITTRVLVGVGTYININSTVGHCTKIGNFCHVAPGSNISGDCVVGDRVYVGTGSKIIEKISIGNDVVLGAGSVVIDYIRSNVLAVGVPARIKKELP